MDLISLAKACEATSFAVLVTNLAGLIAAIIKCYRDGWWGNQFAAMWICLLGGVLAAQSYHLYKKPQLSTASAGRHLLWLVYTLYMAAAAVIIILGYAIVPMPSVSAINPTGWWAATWLPSSAFMLVYLRLHRLHASRTAAAAAAEKQQRIPQSQVHVLHVDMGVASPRSQDPAASPDQSSGYCSSWRQFRSRAAAVMRVLGWSSILWAVPLTFFLILQAAWLAADYNAFPAARYGQLVLVPIDNTDYTANLFIRCVGPDSAGLSTFVLEAGDGAPAASLFGLQDAIAAAGRRSCSYDRLGLGWSDDYIVPGHLKRIPFTLYALLAAAGEAPPYILVGHGQGGQLALQYATMYPEQVAGLALLDSYSATAHHLEQGVVVNDTDVWGITRYKYLQSYPQLQLSKLSLLRAVTPFGWVRFMHRQVASDYTYQAAVNALYGNNKASQGRWGEYSAAVAALPDSLDELLLLAAPQGESFWYGTGWKDFGPLPVVVMPAADTVAAAGCDISQPGCQANVLAAAGNYYPKLVLAYVATLSSNASLSVVPSDYGFPWNNAPAAAGVLVEKFAGV